MSDVALVKCCFSEDCDSWTPLTWTELSVCPGPTPRFQHMGPSTFCKIRRFIEYGEWRRGPVGTWLSAAGNYASVWAEYEEHFSSSSEVISGDNYFWKAFRLTAAPMHFLANHLTPLTLQILTADISVALKMKYLYALYISDLLFCFRWGGHRA
jgi:hypothetical protein